MIRTNEVEKLIEMPGFLISSVEIQKETQAELLRFAQGHRYGLLYIRVVQGHLVRSRASVDESLRTGG